MPANPPTDPDAALVERVIIAMKNTEDTSLVGLALVAIAAMRDGEATSTRHRAWLAAEARKMTEAAVMGDYPEIDDAMEMIRGLASELAPTPASVSADEMVDVGPFRVRRKDVSTIQVSGPARHFTNQPAPASVSAGHGCTRCDAPADCHPDCPHQPRKEAASVSADAVEDAVTMSVVDAAIMAERAARDHGENPYTQMRLSIIAAIRANGWGPRS